MFFKITYKTPYFKYGRNSDEVTRKNVCSWNFEEYLFLCYILYIL